MKWFGRSPALWSSAALTVVQLVAVVAHMPSAYQNALSIIVTALFTLVVTLTTRPIDFAVVTGVISTLATAAAVLGFNIPQDWVSAFNVALVAVSSLLLTNLVNPSAKLGGPVHSRLGEQQRRAA